MIHSVFVTHSNIHDNRGIVIYFAGSGEGQITFPLVLNLSGLIVFIISIVVSSHPFAKDWTTHVMITIYNLNLQTIPYLC